MPSTSCKLLDALGVGLDERTWEFTELGKGGVKNIKAVELFERRRRDEKSKHE
jgi:hypothetical protein